MEGGGWRVEGGGWRVEGLGFVPPPEASDSNNPDLPKKKSHTTLLLVDSSDFCLHGGGAVHQTLDRPWTLDPTHLIFLNIPEYCFGMLTRKRSGRIILALASASFCTKHEV